MSRDLKSWEPLRDYERHDMFDAIEPLLFQEGDDTWMFYCSNRFELNSVSTDEVRLGAKSLDDRHGFSFQLWLTRTRDAAHWTRPIPIRFATFGFSPRTNWGSYDKTSLVGMPAGSFALLNAVTIIENIGPGRVAEQTQADFFEDVGWPRYDNPPAPDRAAAVFDPSGVCHFFSCWTTGDVYYCRPKAFARTANPIKLFHTDATIRTLLPFLSGNRLLLFCASDMKLVVRGGIVESGQVRMGEPLVLPGLTYRNTARQLFFDGTRIYLPVGGNVRERPAGAGEGRRLPEDADPFATSDHRQPRRSADNDDDNLGARLLQGNFDKLFEAVVPK